MKLQSSMVERLLLLAILLSVTPALADSGAQDKDSDKIIEAAIIRFEYGPYCINFRGGASKDKPLGIYRNGKFGTLEIRFENQEYVRLDSVVKAHWALSLHKFMVHEGGGIENTWIVSLAGPRPNQPRQDPLDITFVPYPVVESFAEDFFKNNAKEMFDKLSGNSKVSFLNEAILDAVNLYGAYEEQGLDQFNDYALWTMRTLDRYKHKIGAAPPAVSNREKVQN